LSTGESFTIDDFGGSGRELHVIVEDISLTTVPGYAHVLILLKDVDSTGDAVNKNPGNNGKNNRKKDKNGKKDKKGKDKGGEKDKKGKGKDGKNKNKKKSNVKRRRWL